jgi:Rrf2 family transcriptional regulator, iron-sulfur cluster assembly transcription factor
MLNLSKTVGYAVHALSCLDQADGRPLFVQEIAERTGIVKPYLARIINRLVHEGLLVSKRGYQGGVALALPASQITLMRIVEVLEGTEWSRQCFFGLETCPAARRCPAHDVWSTARRSLAEVLSHTSLASVSQATQAGPVAAEGPRRVGPARLAA